MTEPAPVLELLLPDAAAGPDSLLRWAVGGADAAVARPGIGERFAATLLATQFVYVYDHGAAALVFLSAGVQALLGERPHAQAVTEAWFQARLHPDDAPAVAQAQALVGRYLAEAGPAPLPHFRFSLDYRLRHADGHYRRVLHEHLLLERDPGTGTVGQSLHLFTDLTFHKFTREVRFHVNQPGFAVFAARQQATAPVLTRREQQILGLVLQGLTSRQIGYQLQLREHSIKSHRRNIARKTATHSFHRLLAHLLPATGP